MIYQPKDAEELKNIIERYDAISFDVWDTLITRTVLQPEDVFIIVENRAKEMQIGICDYCKNRVEAIFHVERANPDITEIYDALQKATGISDREKEVLMKLEIQTETDVVIPREEMVGILNYAVELGKQVNLITDMYLPGNIMEKLLEQTGISVYDNLIVSCDYRQLKIEGLFLTYKEKVQAKSYLHIGDNFNSDIVSAEKNGIDAVQIKSGYNILITSVFSELLEKAVTHNERCMVGLFSSRLFNSPFAENRKRKVCSTKDLGWLFIAPIISEFMLWLGMEMQKDNYAGVLFAARDGYIVQKLYQEMQEIWKDRILPQGFYFLTSRALCTQAGIVDEKDIIWLSMVKFHGTLQELLQYRFCLEDMDILSPEGRTTTEYVLLHKEKIFGRVKENRENYLAYMEKQGIEFGKKYAFFDFVSSGTSQLYLSRFAPFEIEGKYFCRSIVADEKAELKINSLYVNDGVEKADSYFYKNYKYLETIMTSLMPSLRYIDKNLNAVYDEETRNAEELQFVQDIQDAIENYFIHYIKMADRNAETDVSIAEILWQYMGEGYVDIACKTLDSMRLRDDWVREFAEK